MDFVQQATFALKGQLHPPQTMAFRDFNAKRVTIVLQVLMLCLNALPEPSNHSLASLPVRPVQPLSIVTKIT